jgi:hypothetical protein
MRNGRRDHLGRRLLIADWDIHVFGDTFQGMGLGLGLVVFACNEALAIGVNSGDVRLGLTNRENNDGKAARVHAHAGVDSIDASIATVRGADIVWGFVSGKQILVREMGTSMNMCHVPKSGDRARMLAVSIGSAGIPSKGLPAALEPESRGGFNPKKKERGRNRWEGLFGLNSREAFR